MPIHRQVERASETQIESCLLAKNSDRELFACLMTLSETTTDNIISLHAHSAPPGHPSSLSTHTGSLLPFSCCSRHKLPLLLYHMPGLKVCPHTHTHTHTHNTQSVTDRHTDKQTLHPSAPGSTESLKSQNFYQDKDVQNAAEGRVNTAPSIPQPPIYAPPAKSPRNDVPPINTAQVQRALCISCRQHDAASPSLSSSSPLSRHALSSSERLPSPLPPKHSPAAKPRGSKARQCVMASIVPTLPPR